MFHHISMRIVQFISFFIAFLIVIWFILCTINLSVFRRVLKHFEFWWKVCNVIAFVVLKTIFEITKDNVPNLMFANHTLVGITWVFVVVLFAAADAWAVPRRIKLFSGFIIVLVFFYQLMELAVGFGNGEGGTQWNYTVKRGEKKHAPLLSLFGPFNF